jgi:cytochrome P450
MLRVDPRQRARLVEIVQSLAERISEARVGGGWLGEVEGLQVSLDAGPEDGHDTRAFLPFGAGPRYCPGHNLAMLEATTVLAMAVRNFAIARPAGAPPTRERFAFTLQPVDLTVRLTPRPF